MLVILGCFCWLQLSLSLFSVSEEKIKFYVQFFFCVVIRRRNEEEEKKHKTGGKFFHATQYLRVPFSGGCFVGIKREEQCVFYCGAQKNHRYAGHKHQCHKKGISVEGERRQKNKIMIESWII